MSRIAANAVLAVSVFALPWWFAAAAGALFIAMFPSYIEAVGAGFALDMLYGAPIESLGGFAFPFSAGGLLLYVIITEVGARLRR